MPTIEKYVDDENVQRMVDENKDYIQNGWKLGIDVKNAKDLNKNTYPDDWLGEEAEIETAMQITEELINGKCIPIKGGEKNIIPQFVIPKKVDLKTNEITKWRWIRDCTHSGKGEVSLNDITPDENANVKMPFIKDIMRMLYIMWKAYGFG